MSYSRDEVKTITDKVLNMAKADGVEVSFAGGERSATRYANSTITANLVEQEQELAKRRPDNPELMPLVKPPQDYLPVDAALSSAVAFGPAERGRIVQQSVAICEK